MFAVNFKKHKRLFENNPLIKNRKKFLGVAFFKKATSFEAFLEKASPKTFIISRGYRTNLFKQSKS